MPRGKRAARARFRYDWAPLWHWLGIAAAGTLIPFGFWELAYCLQHQGHWPPQVPVLGSGALLVPAAIMLVEASWVFRHGPAATGTGAAFGSWAAGLAAVGAVFLYGVFAAAGTAPPGYREPVGTADSRWLAHAAVVTSLSTVVLALILGSAAAALAVVYSKQKQGEGPSE